MHNHRPYPPPATPPLMNMRWNTLLFAHWRVDAAALRPLIPPALSLDTFDGSAWIAIVPFTMSHTHPVLAPVNVPRVSDFVELNVRTYVTRDGKPGVWFFSLDAASRFAVRVARRLFFLPYMDAEMECEFMPTPNPSRQTGGEISYTSRRTHKGEPPAAFEATYGPCGPAWSAQPGSLEYFLTARYCLYAGDAQGHVYRGEVDHADWPLQPAQCDIRINTMTAPISLHLSPTPDHLLYVRQLDVVAWALQKC
jgi:uncharacterized protein YqjF (DUF2071 family)